MEHKDDMEPKEPKKEIKKTQPKKIILATDGSMPALMATKKAVELAVLMNTSIIAVAVEEDTPQMELEKREEELAEEQYRLIHVDGLKVAEEYAKQKGVKIETRNIVDGPIVGAILDVAKHEETAMIVLGNSGRSGWEKLSLGSVAESMVNHSTFPVLVTKVTTDGYEEDIRYLDDILSIAKSFPAEVKKAVEKVLEAPDIKGRLRFSLKYLALFLVPYFGLAGVNSLYKDFAMTEVFAGLSVAVVGAFLLYPIAWTLGLAFNKAYESKYEA